MTTVNPTSAPWSESTIELTVNGKAVRKAVEARTTLAALIRDGCNLTGTKLGCEHGVCGSCTVLLNGSAVRSCTMLAAQADGASVTTVEGLSDGKALNTLQQNFRNSHGLQCGFCTAGFLTTLTELLDDSDASLDESGIRGRISGNLCRCTGYETIVDATLATASGVATAPEDPPDRPLPSSTADTAPPAMAVGDDASGATSASVVSDAAVGVELIGNGAVPSVATRLIGARVARTEDPKLLSGHGKYLDDLQAIGELHAVFVRSTIGHARISRIDIADALTAPGVHLAWTGEDVGALCEGMEGTLSVEGCTPTFMPLVSKDEVCFAGEAVAIIVAETRAEAEDAAELVVVDFEALDAVVDAAAARAGGPLACEANDSNIVLDGAVAHGDVDGAFDRASEQFSATYKTGRLAPLPIEGRGCIAEYQWSSGQLTVYAGSQLPHLLGYLISVYCGFAEQNVEVIVPETGGGFGLKAHVYPEELVVCLLARELDARVKWVEDRTENLLAAVHAHQQEIELAYSIDDDGLITGMRMDALGDGGAYHSVPWSMAVEPWCTAAMNPTGIYDVASFSNSYCAVATNKSPVGAYRGVGYMAGVFVREALVDEVARARGESPFDFRRRNVVKAFPWTNPAGVTYDEGSWAECIDTLEELVDYQGFLKRQRLARAEGRHIGLGTALFVESSGESTATSLVHGLVDTYHDTATVRMDPQGTVTVTTGLTTQGQGNRATMAQIAADMLGVRFEDVTVICGESSKQAWGSGTVGSRAAVVAGGAVMRAGDVLRTKLTRVAAHLLEASEGDIELINGQAQVAGSPDQAMSIADIATAVYFDISARPDADFEPSLEATLSYDPERPIFSNGAHAFEVEVDTETGLVEISHAFAVEDCGRMINPAIVEGQIRGGMTQGIGAALFEELIYDEDANLQTTTLADYFPPTADVVPRFSFAHIETLSAHSPAGVKGMGESGLIASPAAMLNAVNDALAPLGVTIREIPMTPERILNAIDAASAQG